MATTSPARPSQSLVFQANDGPKVVNRSTPLTIQIPTGVTCIVEGTCDNDGLAAGNPVWGDLGSLGAHSVPGGKLYRINEEVSALRFTPSGVCTIFLAGEL